MSETSSEADSRVQELRQVVISAALEWHRARGHEALTALGALTRACDALAAPPPIPSNPSIPLGIDDEMIWVERVWRDVRNGDLVRPPGTTLAFMVHSAATNVWHVDPASPVYSPTALEHSKTRVVFVDEAVGDDFGLSSPREMNPGASVEIWFSRREAETLDALGPLGWPNRISTLRED
jgi:hypothetical protein